MTASGLWSQTETHKPLCRNQTWILSSTSRPPELWEADPFSLTSDIVGALSSLGLLILLLREEVVKLSHWNPVSGMVIWDSALSETRKTLEERETHTHTQYLKTTSSNVIAVRFPPSWTKLGWYQKPCSHKSFTLHHVRRSYYFIRLDALLFPTFPLTDEETPT